MNIFFIRHGESESNVQGVYAGQSEYPLTDNGRAQARQEGKRLFESKQKFDVIISSELGRAYETAKIIADSIDYPEKDIEILALLNERSGGSYEGKNSELLFSLSEKEQIEAGAESFERLGQRAEDLIRYLKEKHPDKNILLVSHAGFGQMLLVIRKFKDYRKFLDGDKIPNAKTIEIA